MKKLSKEKIFFIIKISFFIVFWPFVLIYFLHKKYKERKLEKIKQFVLKEIEKRYEKFPYKEKYTQEEIVKIILKEIEIESQLKKQEKLNFQRDIIQKAVLFDIATNK